MVRCPSCGRDSPAGTRFCSWCGVSLAESEVAPTATSVPLAPPPAGPEGSGASASASTPPSSVHGGESRFLPGAVVAGRYRIVGLTGRGGMGEVYRADDLKLGQPVALKFLPEHLQHDADRLQRFLGEVRTARQIAHPNVCRVYDVGEIGGTHYLSMEFVDGEDLASLLRRVGRIPNERAVQLARQLCAGLAAAHAQGFLHRDLKPANVMIDGRGRVRITDFGLAAIVGSVEGAEIRAGTPGYMAPEQLRGESVTVRSDVYSLGLVLYEMFTGDAAFRAGSTAELTRLQTETTPELPSSRVGGFDPLVEQVILRCLDRDPERRPENALAISAALPGGDPLAAALAAGETPSPEMVAAAGGSGGATPRAAATLMIVAVVATMMFALMPAKHALLPKVSIPETPEVLRAKSRGILERIGHDGPIVDESFAFAAYRGYLQHVAANDDSMDRWEDLDAVRPSPVGFWYRASAAPLSTGSHLRPVSPTDPPEVEPGMARLRLDPDGRLVELSRIGEDRDGDPADPSETDDEATGPDPDSANGSDAVAPPDAIAATPRPTESHDAPEWDVLFELAELDREAFRPIAASHFPRTPFDRRAAWESSGDEGGAPAIVEAASFGGTPVFFRVSNLGEGSRASTGLPSRMTSGAPVEAYVIISVLVLTAAWIARRNVRAGRGDRRGALRLALAVACAYVVGWLMTYDHSTTAEGLSVITDAIAWSLFIAANVWLIYLALEPYVRRSWPQSLIGWSRLLDGRLRDPRVGRDILIGSSLGGLVAMVVAGLQWIPEWTGDPPPVPQSGHLALLSGSLSTAGTIVTILMSAVTNSVGVLLLIVLVQLLVPAAIGGLAFVLFVPEKISAPVKRFFGNRWVTIVPVWAFMTLLNMGGQGSLLALAVGAVLWTLILIVLLRFGLLACTILIGVTNVLVLFPRSFDSTAWYSTTSLWVFGLPVALAATGAFITLRGRTLFHEPALAGTVESVEGR